MGGVGIMDKNPVQSAERIFNVLEVLCKSGSIGLLELSSSLQLNKSTVHRLLASLIYMGYAAQDKETGKYMPTFKIVGLSQQFLSRLDILSVVHPYLSKLSAASNETVHFVQREGCNVVYIDKIEAPGAMERSIRMASRIGLSRPMYCSAVGKAILAELPEDEQREVWNDSAIEKKTSFTITSFSSLQQELEHVKGSGYAIDNQENELGVRCIAVAIKSYKGGGEYAFSISAPVDRMDDNRVKELSACILETKAEMYRELGI